MDLKKELNKFKDIWCGTYILDENKNAIPCSFEEWGNQLQQMKDKKTKHVADEMVNGFRVSTIWLGLDHQHDDNGPPLLYETMVFKGRESIYEERYSTWQEAEEGHKKAVQRVKDGCKGEE